MPYSLNVLILLTYLKASILGSMDSYASQFGLSMSSKISDHLCKFGLVSVFKLMMLQNLFMPLSLREYLIKLFMEVVESDILYSVFTNIIMLYP